MSEQEKHKKQYSFTDIEQYLQGKLSSAEMHKLEKAALQDPFLADAIEGYKVSDLLKAKEDLVDIQNRLLQEKHEVAKEIPIGMQVNRWWKIAAVIVLFAGAGSLGWYLFNYGTGKKEITQKIVPPAKKDTEQQSLALVNPSNNLQLQKPRSISGDLQKKSSKKLVTAEPVINNEINKNRIAETIVTENDEASITLSGKNTLLKNVTKSIPSSLAQLSNPTPTGTITGGSLSGTLSPGTLYNITSLGRLSALTVSGNTRNVTASITGGGLSGTLSPVALNSITTHGNLNDLAAIGNKYPGNDNKPFNVFSGKVIDTHTLQPIPNASILFEKNNKSTITDNAGNFTFMSIDTLQKIRVNSIGFEQKDQQVMAAKPNQVLLKESNDQLNEVVVTGYSAQRKKDITPSDNILPEGGWESLLSYLTKKLTFRDPNDSSTVVHGAIIAELTLKKGKVQNAVIIHTFNSSLNKPLIQALKHGPKWISSSTDRKEKYTVNFTL